MTQKPFKATIHDVAKQAGVSPATVSRVINGTARVQKDKAARVKQAIEQLNYSSHPLAHQLGFAKGKTAGTIGVLIRSFDSEFIGRVISAFEKQLGNYHMLTSSSQSKPDDERRSLEIFKSRQIDGLFLLAPTLPDTELLALIKDTPTIIMNRFLPELADYCVNIDNIAGGYLPTKHLIELGHTRIANIPSPLDRQFSRGRLEGYVNALYEHGLTRDERLVVEASDGLVDAGMAACERLLNLTDFSAIVAGNDQIACGALMALRKHKLRVPEDISVIGFDNLVVSKVTTPPLSTMNYPMEAMGMAAAKHLLELIKTGKTSPVSMFKPSLLHRSSMAAPAANATLIP